MKPELYTPTFKECLVDGRILRNAYDFFKLNKKPSLTKIYDIFSLAEAFVLFDRLVMPPDWRDGISLKSIDISFLQDLSDITFIKPDITYSSPLDDSWDDLIFYYAEDRGRSITQHFSTFWNNIDPSFQIENLSLDISDAVITFYRAWQWDCDIIISSLWESFFIFDKRKPSSLPKKIYSKLSENLSNVIKELESLRSAFIMKIPPIPSIVLQECGNDISKFWRVVKNIRDEFLPFRNKYFKYQEMIANSDHISLGELIQLKRDIVDEVEHELNLLSKERTDGRILMEIWDAVAKVDIGGKEGEFEFSTGANVKNLLNKSLSFFKKCIVRGRAHCLFNVYKKILNIKEYDKLIVNNFNITLKEVQNNKEVLSKYYQQVEKISGVSPKQNWNDISKATYNE